MRIEITVYTKSGGPLTKRIALAKDGTLKSDGSTCLMTSGRARRVELGSMRALAELIETLKVNEALGLGAPRSDLPDQVEIITKKNAQLNGAARPDIIARTAANIIFAKDREAFALFDFDSKGMPPSVAAEVKRRGGFWGALVSLLPKLESVARVTRRSTSAGIYRTDTGQPVPGSDGEHVYISIADGADCGRFLRALHDRCWRAGFGWMTVSKSGQLLKRSIVDRMVGAPERLVFEGAPVLDPPLAQDKASRRPVAVSGDVLVTATACPPLTIVETARLEALMAKEAHRLAPEARKAREAWIAAKVGDLTACGKSQADARKIAERWCAGVLHPDVVLPFDDPDLAGKTVADVLADPEAYEGETLADPLEGVDYGVCKAKIMLRSDGTPWINSFAHGRSVYELKLDAGSVRKALESAAKRDVVKTFTRLAVDADLGVGELAELRQLAKQLSGVPLSAVDAAFRAARRERIAERAKETRDRQQAERIDPRPQLEVPAADQEWLPVMATLNDVIGGSTATVPPVRDIDGFMTEARRYRNPESHAFSGGTANAEEGEQMPAPEQWALVRMNEMQTAELIERHVEFYDESEDGFRRPVHLPMTFVKHYCERHDMAVPTVVTIAQAPIVLADGGLLAPDGLDRERGIIFMIPNELRALLPPRADCGSKALRAAMKFLCDEWLVDVAVNDIGKCLIIAAALTIIERSLLDNRPAFFISSGRRGGGKTTLINMLIRAITGQEPAASSWSTDEEERRKVLLAQLLFGAPYVLWDNIKRGSQISCPHIERSCTSAFYADRRLGVSEMVRTAASAVHLFTGNNIAPRGELASRSLHIRLSVDRPDPENRPFEHPDPTAWTRAHRAEILKALYTILLGNPQLDAAPDAPAKTRFKMWWRLIGSAAEHAAHCAGFGELDFKAIFTEQEEAEDDDTTTLVEMLNALSEHYGSTPFTAAGVSEWINNYNFGSENRNILKDFMSSGMPKEFRPTPRSVGWRLRDHVDEPVTDGKRQATLRNYRSGHAGPRGPLTYWVEVKKQ